ncbi:MAG: DEAD/DEAH box helicase, partial [Candidatus Omnitrophota bacterium]
MKRRKSKFIKCVSVLLVLALLSEEIAGADGFSFLSRKNNLQPQYFSTPILKPENYPGLLEENRIKFTLQYILENMVPRIDKFRRRIFDNTLSPGMGFVFDFREASDGVHAGKRREGDNWVIPCAIGDRKDIRRNGVYRWTYEVVVNDDKEILRVRKADNGVKKGQPVFEQEERRGNISVKNSKDLQQSCEPVKNPLLERLLEEAEFKSFRPGQIKAINKLKEGIPVELRTGGGKTLTLAGAALTRFNEKGERILVLTHEDVLTEQAMIKDRIGEVLSRLGAVTGFILPDKTGKPAGVIYRDGRRQDVSAEEVYRDSAIIYGKWDRVAHRYMAEKKGSSAKVLSNSRYFTLFDEADLTLVFGASTPAVISGREMENKEARLAIRRAVDDFVSGVVARGAAYYNPEGTKEVYLSVSGERKAGKILKQLERVSDTWRDIVKAEGEAFVLDALRARLFYREGIEYLTVRGAEGKITGVDVRDLETGARKKGMSFGEGLQQAVEIMAGIDDDNITPETYTAMSMTIGQFLKDRNIVTDFAGASGTMEKERFRNIYGKNVEKVEGAAGNLISAGHSGFKTGEEKKQAILERLRARMGKKQPLLIKAASDAETEELKKFIEQSLSGELSANARVINIADARSPADFSAKIAQAGYANVITIVTNLAHRGIEIKGRRLNPDGTEGDEVLFVKGKMPGLHVISTY